MARRRKKSKKKDWLSVYKALKPYVEIKFPSKRGKFSTGEKSALSKWWNLYRYHINSESGRDVFIPVRSKKKLKKLKAALGKNVTGKGVWHRFPVTAPLRRPKVYIDSRGDVVIDYPGYSKEIIPVDQTKLIGPRRKRYIRNLFKGRRIPDAVSFQFLTKNGKHFEVKRARDYDVFLDDTDDNYFSEIAAPTGSVISSLVVYYYKHSKTITPYETTFDDEDTYPEEGEEEFDDGNPF